MCFACSIRRTSRSIRAMELVFRATHNRKMTALERKEFHLPQSEYSPADTYTKKVGRVAIPKHRLVLLGQDGSIQRPPELVRAMENVFRATHMREMTDYERREFQLPTIEKAELVVAA